jgi:hypothetical protein
MIDCFLSPEWGLFFVRDMSFDELDVFIAADYSSL